MAFSLGRAGVRALLTASHAAKGGAGRQIPVAGFKYLQPGSLQSQFRVAHSLVVVVIPDGPIDADSVSLAVKKGLADLDVKLRAGRFDPKEDATDGGKDADSKEMQGLFDDNVRNAMNGRNDDRYLMAIQKMCRNLDVALYGVKWTVETCFAKLEARIVGQSILDARPERNFYASFLHEAGKRILPRKVILVKRALMVVLPYFSRYYLYCLCGYSLLTSDVPWCALDYGLILVGSQLLVSHEMKTIFGESYKFYQNGGKKVKDAVGDADQTQE